MKIVSSLLLLTLLLSYSLPTAQSKTKRKPKGGAACSQGTPYRNCPACGTTSDKRHQALNVLKNRDTAATNTKHTSHKRRTDG